MSEIALDCGPAHAKIALAGAEARSWRVAGRDLLWPGDPAIWAEISPVLYPVVGRTRDGVRVGGRRYALGLHGFARFVLRDNERTRAVYPFAFSFAVECRLSERALGMAFEIANPGGEPAPYACGLHPGFRWPLARRAVDAPGAPFVCLEAWTGYGDPAGFAGELFDKPSMRLLAPGGAAHHEARFVYSAA